MELNKLQSAFDDYFKSIETINTKRKYWNDVSKNLLISILKDVKNSFSLDAQIQVLDERQNNETVNLSFNNIPSGIFIKTEKSFKSYIKNGGALCFGQGYSGDVFVFILYPYVEELVSRREHTLLETCSPEYLSENKILQFVETFIKELTAWESKAKTSNLGFLNRE